MKWKKLGRIFNPVEYKLFNNCIEFAQSPQTLIFDDFIRIYFSTREIDRKNGKFLSHVAYIEVSKDFKNILNISSKTVVPLGELGTFDEHGIFPINILRDNDEILAFTCGWSRRLSVSVETSTGLAISSDDGITFQKIGNGPIFSSTINEPFLVGDSFVKKFNGLYHMWYMFGVRWIDSINVGAQSVYKIGHATSKDRINWLKEEAKQIIPYFLNKDECQALPSVLFHNNKYHMYFCYREATDFRNNKFRGYALGYAYSEDLINWTRDEKNVGITYSQEGWDSDMMCYPHIFKCDNKVYLLYNGNEFGKYGFGVAMLEE